MVVMGVIMIKVVPGQERFVYSSLKIRDEILDVYNVFGEYDFILMLETESICELNQFMERMQEMKGIIAIKTILIKWDSGLQEHKPIEVLA
jgi:DNA-binding Lrp family transcriptional regulator